MSRDQEPNSPQPPNPNSRVFQSSNLQSGSYDPITLTLTLTFTGGGTYVYTAIDQKTWEGLRDEVSHGVGSVFASIRSNPDKFPVTKLKPDQS